MMLYQSSVQEIFALSSLVYMQLAITAAACEVKLEVLENMKSDICKVTEYLKLGNPVKIVKGNAFSSSAADKFLKRYHTVTVPSRILGSDISSDQILGGVVHELAHLKQFEDFGSLRKTVSSLGNTTVVELEAEFIAGCIWKAVFPDKNKKFFQANVELRTSYETRSIEFHGTPAQRNNSFRNAFYGHNYLCRMQNFNHGGFLSEVWPNLND